MYFVKGDSDTLGFCRLCLNSMMDRPPTNRSDHFVTLNTPSAFPPGHELSEKYGRKRVCGFQQRHVSPSKSRVMFSKFPDLFFHSPEDHTQEKTLLLEWLEVQHASVMSQQVFFNQLLDNVL